MTFTKNGFASQCTAKTSLSSHQMTLDETPESEKAAVGEKLEKQVAVTKDQLRAKLTPGLEAFSVQTVYGNRPVEFFVFCDPATKQVVVDPNFKNIHLTFVSED